jgi:hypothetical protein
LVIKDGVSAKSSSEIVQNLYFDQEVTNKDENAEKVEKWSNFNPYANGLYNCLAMPEIALSIGEDIFIEDLIERIAIVNIFLHGLDVFDDIDNRDFRFTGKILQDLANATGENSREEIGMNMNLHFQLMDKYQKIAMEEYKNGVGELEKAFVSQI